MPRKKTVGFRLLAEALWWVQAKVSEPCFIIIKKPDRSDSFIEDFLSFALLSGCTDQDAAFLYNILLHLQLSRVYIVT